MAWYKIQGKLKKAKVKYNNKTEDAIRIPSSATSNFVQPTQDNKI